MAKHLAKCPKCGGKLTYESAGADRIPSASCGAILKPPGKDKPNDPLIGQVLKPRRVEKWRGGVGMAYRLSGALASRCLTSHAVLRFHFPLIDPDVRFSRMSTRYSQYGHRSHSNRVRRLGIPMSKGRAEPY